MKFINIFIILVSITIAGKTQNICKQQFLGSDALRTQNDFFRSVASQNTDIKYYRCFFENTPNVRNIKGFVVIAFKTTVATNSISFDFKSNMLIDSVEQGTNPQNLTVTRPVDAVQMNLNGTLAAGVLDSVKIYYNGTPLTTDGYFATGTHSAAPITYTLSEPYGARYWWPCKDDVVDKADSVIVTLKYPNTYVGVANGLLTSETNDGTFKYSTWVHKHPIAAYLVAFAITNYTKFTRTYAGVNGSIAQINYVYPETVTTYNNSIANLNSAFTAFENKFGAYPYTNEQYAQTQIQTGVGGMEHQTNSFVDSWGGDLLAHELLHQWFGDLVTCNTWKDIWLNEGFASYGEAIYKEQNGGFTTLVTEMKNRAATINATTTGAVYRTDTSTVNSIFNYRLTYLKASYVVHMLRWYLGDNAFYQQCRSYLNAPGVKNGFATTDTLKRFMEAGLPSSNNNLTEFFNDWVYGQGYPSYQVEWNQVGANAIVKLGQTSASAGSVPFYEMPVPVKLIGTTKDTTVRLMHITNGQSFSFPLSFTVNSVQFDPDAWILSSGNTVTQNTALGVTSLYNMINDPSIKIGTQTNSVKIIKLATTLLKKVELYSIDGRLIQQLNGNQLEIQTTNLVKGKYILKLYHANGKLSIHSFVK